ncbi:MULTISPECIES: Rrf2 family transcriptional regulator [Thiomicrorhabdus]|uniref:Rrf2 family transcriptional regulator n=1 Tax=Thiomicrorhabdus heinhorstiae TaxID=2748010 RepID=A0ABS0C0M9_9GAMM|nr:MULTISPECIES: Rrf2 family transcriptional regulator [Thiomicrorhabdus]MBF6058814.1 Rrf2 family transcriptional regulator [Thiomicrorhabdus heinhorstiae]
MKLTSKGRYAVTAMIDIALNQEKGAITLSLISDRQGISLSYLEQLFAKLKKADLVSSARGPGGGYRLSKEAADISVSDIIRAVDESVDARKCAGKQNCHGGEECLSHELWSELSENIDSFLKGITLQTIIDKKHNQQNAQLKEIRFS